MYWFIQLYQKCKVKDIELGVMQVVLIRGYNWKNLTNIALKIERDHSFWDDFFLQMGNSLWDGESTIAFCK
jgi:hypothetical protein